MPQQEVLFEFKRIGNIVRVAAMDSATGIEVVVQAPVTARQADLKQLALAKLNRALKEKS